MRAEGRAVCFYRLPKTVTALLVLDVTVVTRLKWGVVVSVVTVIYQVNGTLLVLYLKDTPAAATFTP